MPVVAADLHGGPPGRRDEFTPIFMWVVLHCGVEGLFSLSELLWAVAAPHRLSGEGGYYLSQLSSALAFLLQAELEDSV